MITNDQTLDAVVRFSQVTLTQKALEGVVGCHLDRLEPSRTGFVNYAQINLPEGSSWSDLSKLIDRIGLLIQTYIKSGEIVRPHIDAILYVQDDKASASLQIPHAASLIIGRWGFDLEVSAYLTASG